MPFVILYSFSYLTLSNLQLPQKFMWQSLSFPDQFMFQPIRSGQHVTWSMEGSLLSFNLISYNLTAILAVHQFRRILVDIFHLRIKVFSSSSIFELFTSLFFTLVWNRPTVGYQEVVDNWLLRFMIFSPPVTDMMVYFRTMVFRSYHHHIHHTSIDLTWISSSEWGIFRFSDKLFDCTWCNSKTNRCTRVDLFC